MFLAEPRTHTDSSTKDAKLDEGSRSKTFFVSFVFFVFFVFFVRVFVFVRVLAFVACVVPF
ncbi:MAG: hypothetical protein KIS92_25785 [Planctomycetota bacterium]|nr:hypothetical protein [Planctomycetota bacterium]